MANPTATTITEFLQSMGVASRFFDCGRRIEEIPAKVMLDFENSQQPYPAPYLQHAWMALLLWDPETANTPLLWFLKLPLDEQAKLVPAARDAFLKQLLLSVGHNLQALADGDKVRGILDNNPYTFTPSPERQACMHAKAKQLLQLEPSQHYAPTCAYLAGDLNRWQHLAVQGLADIAVRWPQHQQVLIAALPALPETPLLSLCQCLENEALSGLLTKALSQRLIQEREHTSSNDAMVAALIRAMSASQADALRQKTLQSLLAETTPLSIEVLAAIATRCHRDLHNPLLCLPFLEQLARQPQATFNRVLADLLFLPELRGHILSCFRLSERSDELAMAIGGLLYPAQQTTH